MTLRGDNADYNSGKIKSSLEEQERKERTETKGRRRVEEHADDARH